MSFIKSVSFLIAISAIVFCNCQVLINPSAEIEVRQNDNSITSGSEFDFGQILLGESSPITVFTIENVGNKKLILSGDPDGISISGDLSEFTTEQNNVRTMLKPGESTTFAITFSPTSEGDKSAVVSIDNNDLDENPFTFTIVGKAYTAPEINVKDSSMNDVLCSSGLVDFGTILVNTKVSKTFLIQNVGSADLLISDIEIDDYLGAGSMVFFITTQPTNLIAPGDDSTLTIEYRPKFYQVSTAKVKITNNDSDENPYTFTITAQSNAPDMNVLDPKLKNIHNGSGIYDWGTRKLDLKIDCEFTIQNLGDGELILSGSPVVSISGTGSSAFTVLEQPNSVVSPGSDTTFKIEFYPQVAQQYSATVSIENNDSNDNPYTFTICGTGVIETNLDFNGDGIDDIFVGACFNDNGGEYSGCAYLFLGNTHPSSQTNASNADLIITGESKSYFGYSVASVGDFNNDGLDDVIIGAPNYDVGNSWSGAAYIFFGRKNITSQIINISSADVKIYGVDRGGRFGSIVSSAGDFNNDGFCDVIVGAWNDNSHGPTSGCAYIFFGSSNPPSVINASSPDVKITGTYSGDHFGISVACIGDFNDDGFDDVIIGEEGQMNTNGKAYVILGTSTPKSTIAVNDADIIFHGQSLNSKFGLGPSSAGDFNHDGYDDVIIGAFQEITNGITTGRSYIFYGCYNPASEYFASNADVTLEYSNHVAFGIFVSSAGDFNHDGYNDVTITALDSNSFGRVYIFFSSKTPASKINASNANVIIDGVNPGEYFGCPTSTIGDFNRDNISDIAVGAHGFGTHYTESGCAYIFFGSSSPVSSLNASNADVTMIGEKAGDTFGMISIGR